MQYVDEMENKLDEMTKFFIFNQEEFKAELDSMLKMASSNLEMLSNADKTIQERDQQLLDKEETIKNMESKKEEIVKEMESRYGQLDEQFKFIESVLASQTKRGRVLSPFKNVIDSDFMKFSNQNLSHIEDAQVMSDLQKIDKKLQQIIDQPTIYSKKILCLSGAKGSGKTEFIRGFLQSDAITLAIGEHSVRSLATYFVSNPSNTIVGYTPKGSSLAMDGDMYERIMGEYSRSFRFNIEELISFILIQTPLSDELVKNICIVEAPPFSTEENIIDSFEAQNNNDMDAMIWMIDAKSSSNIAEADLEFLKALDREEKKLYILVNKIDAVDKNNIKKMLSEIKTTLQGSEISFEGISAYSSSEKKEYSYMSTSLNKFLEEYNKPILMQEDLIAAVYSAFDLYRDAIEKTLKNEETVSKQFDLLELDLKEEGLEDENGIVSLRFSILRKLCREKELKENLKLIDVAQKKFISAINKVFGRNINI